MSEESSHKSVLQDFEGSHESVLQYFVRVRRVPHAESVAGARS